MRTARRSTGAAGVTRSSSARPGSASTTPRGAADALEQARGRARRASRGDPRAVARRGRGRATSRCCADELARAAVARPADESREPAASGVRTRGWTPGSRLLRRRATSAGVGDRRRGGVRAEVAARGRLRGSGRPAGRGSRGSRPSSTRATSTRSWPALDGLVPPPRASRTSTGGPVRRASPSSTSPTSALGRDPVRFARIQVTHREIERARARRRRAPPSACTASRSGSTSSASRSPSPSGARPPRARARPPGDDAFVVGSFQKDGVGLGRRDRAEADQGPGRARRRARRSLAARVPDLVVLLTGPGSRVTCAGSSSERGVPYVHRLLPDARRRSPAPTTRSTRTVVASRQEGGPKSVLESMATGIPLVTTRAGPGAGARRRRRRTACSSTSRTSRASRPALAPDPRRRRPSPTRLRAGGRATAERELARGASRRAGRRCSTALTGAGGASMTGRVRPVRPSGVAVGAARRASGGPTPGLRVFYGWDEIPAPGEPVAGGTVEAPEARRRGSRTTRPDFSLLYLGSTSLPRDLRALLGYARQPADPGRRQPGRRRVSGLGGRRGRRSSTCRCAARCSPPTTSSTRARSASARPTRFLGTPRGTLGDPAERGRRRPVHARPACPTAGRSLLLGGDQTQAYRLELGLRALAALVERPRGAAARDGRRVVDAEAARRASSASQGRVELARPVRAARTRPRSSAARTSCCTRR